MVAIGEQIKFPMLVIHRLRVIREKRRAGDDSRGRNQIQANGQRKKFHKTVHGNWLPPMLCPLCFIPGPVFLQAGSGKNFAFFPARLHADGVIQPLALVFYEKLMPGSQLVNKLQDLNYRVQTVNDPALLQPGALQESPLLVVADLAGGDAVFSAIAGLKADAATSHIPVIAFAAEGVAQAMEAAQKAGAKLVVSEIAIANHLAELLNQALQIE